VSGVHLQPDFMVERIWDISPQRLRAEGIRFLIIDLDNTLVDWGQARLRGEVERWAKQCRELELSICICTNARCKPRTARIAARLGAGYLSAAGKPFAQAYRRALELLRADAPETAFIGDQIFTDTWGANRLGLRTFLVKPLSPRDFPATRLPRLLEQRLFRSWRKSGKDFTKSF